MAGFAPAATIDAPPRLPLPFGLFSVVSLAESSTERWENGVSWEATTCGPAKILISDCEPGNQEGFPKEFPDNPGRGEAFGFTVYGTYKCSGPQAVEAAQPKAVEHLLSREEAGAETALWRKLRDALPTTTLTGGDPAAALAQAEEFIGDSYGSLGVIHMGRKAASILAGLELLVVNGRQMQTRLGTPVVVGAGYPSESGPGAATAPAGSQYIVASPALFGYRSQIFEATNRAGDLMDRGNNDVFGIAERNYLIGFDVCGVAFAPVTLGG